MPNATAPPVPLKRYVYFRFDGRRKYDAKSPAVGTPWTANEIDAPTGVEADALAVAKFGLAVGDLIIRVERPAAGQCAGPGALWLRAIEPAPAPVVLSSCIETDFVVALNAAPDDLHEPGKAG